MMARVRDARGRELLAWPGPSAPAWPSLLAALTPLAAVALLAAMGCAGSPPAAEEAAYVVVQVPAAEPVESWARTEDPDFPPGTRLVLARTGGGAPIVLSSGLDAAAWPAVSPDGTQVVFSGRQAPGEPWRPWLADLQGGSPRPLPSGPGSCTAPRWLAGGALVLRCAHPAPPSIRSRDEGAKVLSRTAADLARAAEQAGFPVAQGSAEGALFVLEPGAAAPQRITFDLRAQGAPEVLPDGRIVFGERFLIPVAERETFEEWTGLMEVQADGTAADRLHDRLLLPQLKLRPRWVGEGALAFIGVGAGQAASGRGALYEVSLRWPSAPSTPLRHDLSGSVVAVAAGPAGTLLLCLQPEGVPVHGVYLADRRPGSPLRLQLADPDHHAADAELLAPRPAPAGHLSAVQPGKAAWLYLLDAYLTAPGAGFSIHRGAVRKAILLGGEAIAPPPPLPEPEEFVSRTPPPPEPEPCPAAGGPTPGFVRHVLGEFLVHEDGSFLVQVPADTPLTLQLAGSGDELVREVGGWFWLRPNEKRGCIGCHEQPQRTPPNRPVQAFAHPPARLVPGAAGRTLALPVPERGEPDE